MVVYAADSYELLPIGTYEKKEEKEPADNAPQGSAEIKISLPEGFFERLKERLLFTYENKHLTAFPEKRSISDLHPRVFVDESDTAYIDTAEEAERETRKRGLLPDFMRDKPKGDAKARGISTHQFLQFFDPKNLKEKGTEAELMRLVSEGFLSNEDKERVRTKEIEAFISSEFFNEFLTAKSVRREFRFNVNLPAGLFAEEGAKPLYEGLSVLVQGVIDCIIEDGEGNLHLVDYKTDRLTESELLDRDKAKAELNRRYSTQLSYYALAIKEIFGKMPSSCRVYSLHLNDTVDIELHPSVL